MRIIGIAGYAGAGKNLVGDIIKKLTPDENWELKSFGLKVKQIASILLDVPVEKFEDRAFKDSLLCSKWSYPTKTPLDYIDAFKNVKFMRQMSIREFLQRLGTDALRNNLHNDCWINGLFSNFTINSKWIITDVRFLNEIKAIKDRKGIVIKKVGNIDNKDSHKSEIELNSYKNWDYVLNYYDDKSDLKKEVQCMLNKLL